MAVEGLATPIDQPVEDAGEALEMAQASLVAEAAAWLHDPKTRKQLRKRWDQISRTGADQELIRLVKELSPRARWIEDQKTRRSSGRPETRA